MAVDGSGAMAEAARKTMAHESGTGIPVSSDWALAYTRTLLGVRLDVTGDGDWSMVMRSAEPPPVRPGDRAPDGSLWGPHGTVRVHDLVRDSFAAIYFTDVRRRPSIPDNDTAALRHVAVSSWDAPHDSGLRDRSLFDPGGVVTGRYGLPAETMVLLRPDAHIAAVAPISSGVAERCYSAVTGIPVPREG